MSMPYPWRTRRQKSKPSISGMQASTTMASGRRADSALSAADGRSKSSTTNPRARKARAVNANWAASSSIRKIRAEL